VRFAGDDVTRLSPEQRCRKGIARSFQIPQPFGKMTVFENLMVAATFGAQAKRSLPRDIDPNTRCLEILDQCGLADGANRQAGTLTLLDRKRLELARALATQPKVLLLDEIAGGLTEHEAAELVEEIHRIKAQGITMIWIEHVVHALLAVADRLFVVNLGRQLAEGTPSTVMNDPEVRRIYMGLEV